MTRGVAYGVTTSPARSHYPFVATVLLNRPLTPREMYTGVGDCIVPFIGGWLVDKVLTARRLDGRDAAVRRPITNSALH